MSFKEEQAQKRLEYYQGMSGSMDRPTSPLASRDEKEAYTAQEVGRGNLPLSELSEAYGGRPTGTTRRAIRMQDAYDAQLESRETLQAMDIRQKQFEMSQRDGAMRENAFYYDRGIAEASQKMDAEELVQATTIINAVKDLDPSSPDYLGGVADILGKNPLGADNTGVQKILERLDGANSRYETLRQQSSEAQVEEAKNEKKAKVEISKDLGAYGMSVADFADKDGNIDFVKANEAIGNSYASGKPVEEEKALDKEQRKSIVSKIDSAEEKLLGIRGREAAAQKRFEARPNSREYRTELEAAQLERGIFEDEINRLNRMIGGETPAEPEAGDQPPRSFESVEEAEAARLPKGTIVVIGGRRARID